MAESDENGNSTTKPSAEGTGKESGNVSLPVNKVSTSPAPERSQEYKVKLTPPPPGNTDSPSPENSPPSQNSPPPPPKSPSPSPSPSPPPPSPPPSSPPPSPPPSSPPPSPPPPSSPKTATASPPPKSSPPPEQVSPPPPPPENSKESSPPPAPGKAPGKSEGSSPPPSKGSTPSPPPSQFVSPPALPPQKSNKPQTPGQSQPPRVSPGESKRSPPQSGSTATPSGSISPALSPGSRSLANTADQQNQLENDGNSAVGLAVGGGSVIVALAAIALALFLLRRNKKRTVIYDGNHYKNQQHTTPNSSMPPSYTGTGGAPGSTAFGNVKTFFRYEEVREITEGFSRQNVIGEGGFGCVYKGFLPDGKLVAVKQLKAGSSQGEREFRAEVDIISRVHHRHLVSLVGYCIAEQQRLLIYEFVPNNTLEHHLHGKGLPVLDWSKRLKIAIGSAKGLAYLHEDCHPKIIHRDIKTANILLDNEFEAQVADFGLARLNDTTQTHVSTRIMGTYGYLAPEYATSGKLTDRSDVYSFGVVLLELITGRKALDSQYPDDEVLVEWARERLLEATDSGDVSKVVDPRLEQHYIESELLRMIKIAALCVRHSAPHRPRMVQVVRALDVEISDIYSGLKVGQSTVYDSARYNEDILNFRKTAFGFEDSADFNMNSSEEFSMENGGGNQSSGMIRDSSTDCLCPDPYS